MDYFLELTGYPDLYEAIARDTDATGNPTPEADALLLNDFLKDEHRTMWNAEVVHAFYLKPSFAARVWRNLRYSEWSRRKLAEKHLDDLRDGWFSKKRASEMLDVDADVYSTKYRANSAEAVRAYAVQLDAKRTSVDALCARFGVQTPVPAFIRSILNEPEKTPANLDAAVQKLLSDPREVRERARNKGVPVPFSIVHHGELQQIATTRGDVKRSGRSEQLNVPPGTPPPAHEDLAPIRRALDMDLLGLAFSGGGIRSATFNLGVLQSLAKIGLLRQCDYISTVSGGGYIGSWLAAWIRRESRDGYGTSGTMTEIQRRLSPVRSPNPMDERVRPIRFLREYSNYLTPRSGFFSADTWTMIGIYVRNTLLNQVIIVSLCSAALLVPRLAFSLTEIGRIQPWVPWLLWLIGAGLLSLNLANLRPPADLTAPITAAPPGHQEPPSPFATPWAIQVGVVMPWVLATAFTACYVSYPFYNLTAEDRVGGIGALSIWAGVIVAVSFLAILLFGRTDRCWRPRATAVAGMAEVPPERVSAKTKAVLVILLTAIVSGITAGGLTWVLLRMLAALAAADVDAQRWHAMGLGTAGLLSVLSLTIVVTLGMLGERLPDEHREWWSRLRTFLHVWAIGWLVAFLASLYVPWGFQWLRTHSVKTVSISALAGWISSTIFGVLKGRTAEDDQKAEHEKGEQPASLTGSALRTLAHAAPFIFIIGLVIALSIAIHWTFLKNLPPFSERFDQDVDVYWLFATWTSTAGWWPLPLVGWHVPWTFTWFAVLVGIGFLFSWRVDINDFSIHHFYKNRLVRCYLGASHTKGRQADWFTGFDPKDDVPLQAFDHDAPNPQHRHRTPYPGPYPILNCALNLVGGQDLAWQERQSTSFVFTPKYCGYDVDRAVLSKIPDGLLEDAFVPTSNYYHRGDGPNLGMAMAISGAAANPNMGRASSPALAFLMTVFNVRLGWWVGNPRWASVIRPSPRLGLQYTALELFGGTDDRKKYINLSDGGHFENLGVYELIRRGCRYIIVCDSGQDDRFSFEDLGTLVRQCRTDFGVEIDIAVDRIRERTAGVSGTHCVVGKIHYLHLPKRDKKGRLLNDEGGPLRGGCHPGHEEGYLIYLKPSLTGDEPQDVLEFARRVPEFPHQTTADQWFDESQFESYRKLGMHIGEETFARYQNDDTKPLANLHQLFERLYGFWYPPSTVISEQSTRHAEEYSRVMELIRTTSGLDHLDHTMFENLAPPRAGNPRDDFYICNALIQLIENVYADLALEANWNHPHVQGWMKVFTRWAQQPEFREAWRISEHTYAERFRNFYNDRLRGRALALPRGFIASHRGKGTGEEENTIDAFRRAMRQGASVIELDVRKLATDELVLFHDDSINGQPVDAMTFHELQARVGRPPTKFRDCAKDLCGLVQLDIELKTAGIEREVLGVLRDPDATWRRRDFVLTSFHPSVIANARVADANIRTGLLVGNEPELEDALNNFIQLRTDFVAPPARCLTQKQLDCATAQRVPLVPWEVNTDQQLEAFLRHEWVAGVITDDITLAVDVKRRL